MLPHDHLPTQGHPRHTRGWAQFEQVAADVVGGGHPAHARSGRRHHGEAARPLTVRDARLLRQRGDLGTAWVAPGARRRLTAMSLAGGSFGLHLGPPLHETGCPGVERLEGRSEVLLCLFTFGVQARSFEDSPVAQQRHDHIVVVDA